MKKTVLITGGGRGIGAACARLVAQQGYQVCINYRSDDVAAMEIVRARLARVAIDPSSSASTALESARARSSRARSCSRCWYWLVVCTDHRPSKANGSRPIALSRMSSRRRDRVKPVDDRMG